MYITHIEILISGPLYQFCQSVMGHFKGAVKEYDAHSVTYITFRKDSTQVSCLFNLSQKIQ